MTRGAERIDRIRAALEAANLDALICTLPENVLMLTGYWPVVGTTVAVATAKGNIAVLAPEDEHELAASGWANEVRTYAPGSLTALISPEEAVRDPFRALLDGLDLTEGRLGYEDGSNYEGSSYAATYLYQATIGGILDDTAPGAILLSGKDPIWTLRSALTEDEVDRVRLGCQIAGRAFTSASRTITAGQREPDVAVAFSTPMTVRGLSDPNIQRAGAYTYCMSGPNAALAGAAYARTRDRVLRAGDLVLVHCNSYIDGYWTDITRTYVMGQPDSRQRHIYEAVFEARDAALAAIRPGVRAAAVDASARDVLTDRGLGEYFTHGLGHNVGFSTISADFPPRLHPASPDRLDAGMTFNIEPSVYIKGYGAVRHCDVITIHDDGPEVLTPFQSDMAHLVVEA